MRLISKQFYERDRTTLWSKWWYCTWIPSMKKKLNRKWNMSKIINDSDHTHVHCTCAGIELMQTILNPR